jgi:hypothetical protein
VFFTKPEQEPNVSGKEEKMKTDLYTKVVLTVIALCLAWLCARDVVSLPAARAAAPVVGAQEVIITGVRVPLKDASGAPITDIDGKPMFTGALPVRETGR